MRRIFYFLGIFLFLGIYSCDNTTRQTPEEIEAIKQAKLDSIRIADSIAAVQKHIADSIAEVKRLEKEKELQKLYKKFRVQNDEFGDRKWVYHQSTPKYTNRNSIHLYFQEDNNGNPSNLRFRVQYESGDWLFIRNMIFNIDGENITFIPDKMETDCGYGGRIWEWCDESASANIELVRKIANANKVKIKFNGRQYYDTKNMSPSELQAFKDMYQYYNLRRDD